MDQMKERNEESLTQAMEVTRIGWTGRVLRW